MSCISALNMLIRTAWDHGNEANKVKHPSNLGLDRVPEVGSPARYQLSLALSGVIRGTTWNILRVTREILEINPVRAYFLDFYTSLFFHFKTFAKFGTVRRGKWHSRNIG